MLLRRLGNPAWDKLALGVSLLFALHPLNTEPVNYIVQRTILMCTSFYLGALVFGVLAVEATGAKRYLYTVLGILSFVGALFSKEVGGTWPIMMLLVLLYLKTSSWPDICQALKRYRNLIVVSLAVLLLFLVWLDLPGAIGRSLRSQEPLLHLSSSILTQLTVGIRYLCLALIPTPSRLNVDHDVSLIEDPLNPFVLVSVAVLVGLLGAGLWLFWRERALSIGILWMFVGHLPTSLIPRGEVMVEYRNYLPMVGFCLLVVLVLWRLSRFLHRGDIWFGLSLVGIGLCFSAAVYRRNKDWRDEETLWRDAALKSPQKARPRHGLAHVYLKHKRYQDAIDEAKKAIRLDPEYMLTYVTLGVAYACKGEKGQAERWLRFVINRRGRPDLPSHVVAEAYNNLGDVYRSRKEYKRAIEHFKEAIRIRPLYSAAYQNLGFTCAEIGRVDEAIKYLKEGIRLNPFAYQAFYILGYIYKEKGERILALSYASKALKLCKDPSFRPRIQRLLQEIR